jgi:hypothetical protein
MDDVIEKQRSFAMSKKSVEDLLIAGGENEKLRMHYDVIKTKEDFIALAVMEGYDFTLDEFDAVLNESGDSFDLIGNPAKRQIWWK